MLKHRLAKTLTLATLVFLCSCVKGALLQKQNIGNERLRALLWPADGKPLEKNWSFLSTHSPFETAALEAGDAAFPILKAALDDKLNKNRREQAIACLGVLGGVKARDILFDDWKKSRDPAVLAGLCLCMASTGSPEDIAFLEGVVSGPKESCGEGGFSVARYAIASLGVLKAKQAKAALSAFPAGILEPCIVGRDDVRIAKDSLDWIALKASTPPETTLPDGEKAILAVLRSGISVRDESGLPHEAFYEPEAKRVWSISKGVWSTTPQANNSNYLPNGARLSFNVWLNSSKTRGLVNVFLSFGGLNSKLSIYSLAKNKTGWTVTAVRPYVIVS